MIVERTPGVIAVPCLSWMWSQAVAAQTALVRRAPARTQLLYAASESSSIAAKRNAFVEGFLAAPAAVDWLLFLDSDMVPPPDTITRLLAWDLPIVSALCFMRSPPFAACAGYEVVPGGETVRLAEPSRGPTPLVAVDIVGAACLLIRRAVLEAIPRPWFDHAPGQPGSGEDFYFCRKARAAGFPIHCDTSLVVPHLGVVGVDDVFAAAWCAAHPDD